MGNFFQKKKKKKKNYFKKKKENFLKKKKKKKKMRKLSIYIGDKVTEVDIVTTNCEETMNYRFDESNVKGYVWRQHTIESDHVDESNITMEMNGFNVFATCKIPEEFSDDMKATCNEVTMRFPWLSELYVLWSVSLLRSNVNRLALRRKGVLPTNSHMCNESDLIDMTKFAIEHNVGNYMEIKDAAGKLFNGGWFYEH